MPSQDVMIIRYLFQRNIDIWRGRRSCDSHRLGRILIPSGNIIVEFTFEIIVAISKLDIKISRR